MLRTGITPDHFHARQVDTLPGRFGLRVTEVAEGRLAGELDVLPWMWAPNGYLHAASVIALADTCAGYATVAHLPEGAKGFTTVELKSNFLGTAKEGRIRTECLADHLGRTTHVWSATVFGPTGRRLALFRCTQMILW
jgi:uncharacterized protein (TIGR00369 family)